MPCNLFIYNSECHHLSVNKMAEAILKCVFCNSDLNKLRLFTDDTLQKCDGALTIRKKNNLKYADVILPSNVYSNEGYHAKYYSSFTAVMKKYKKLGATSVDLPSSATLSSHASTSTATTTASSDAHNTEINVSVCIFCNSARKKKKGRWENLHSCGNDSVLQNIIALATKPEYSKL